MKPAISGLLITTKCNSRCTHCGSEPPRIRQSMGRRVIEAAKRFGRFRQGGIGLHGGNPLLWRGEKGEKIGDLALELKGIGVEKFSTTIAPLCEDDVRGLEGLRSLSHVAADMQVAISFNAFTRDADGRKVSLEEMAERFMFTMKVVMGIEIGVAFHMIRYMPSSKKETLEKFPLPPMDGDFPGKASWVWPVGKARGMWIEEAKKLRAEHHDMLRNKEDVCSWDGRNFFVAPDGGLVPGCSIVCTRLEPFASIFDSPDEIERGMAGEYELARRLKGRFFLPACELHVRESKKARRD